MSRYCQITGRTTQRGRSYARRGIAKKKKGIGLKTTGVTPRTFLPNILRKRLWFAEEKRFINIKISAQGLRLVNKKGLAKVVAELRSS